MVFPKDTCERPRSAALHPRQPVSAGVVLASSVSLLLLVSFSASSSSSAVPWHGGGRSVVLCMASFQLWHAFCHAVHLNGRLPELLQLLVTHVWFYAVIAAAHVHFRGARSFDDVPTTVYAPALAALIALDLATVAVTVVRFPRVSSVYMALTGMAVFAFVFLSHYMCSGASAAHRVALAVAVAAYLTGLALEHAACEKVLALTGMRSFHFVQELSISAILLIVGAWFVAR